MMRRWLAGFLTAGVLAVAPGAALAQPAEAAEGGPAMVSEVIPAIPVGGGERVWGRVEYLLWQLQPKKLPALAGTLPGAEADLSRRLPDGDIHPLVGGSGAGLDPGVQSGFRVEAGAWLDPDGRLGLGAGYFQLEHARKRIDLHSDGDLVIGPTFFDPAAGQEILVMSSVPGLRTAAVEVAAGERLWGAELDARYRTDLLASRGRLDLLAGFRHLQFDDSLDVSGWSDHIPGGHAACG